MQDEFGAERLSIVRADCVDDVAVWEEAVRGCSVVHHTASPYFMNPKDPKRDLVDPALKGTVNVLQACLKDGKVRKVILTSSIAAVVDLVDSNKVYTENDWNTESSLDRLPYMYSKTVAERAAWRFVADQQRCPFELLTLCPGAVLGPSLSTRPNTTTDVVKDLMNGKSPFIVDMGFNIVDVRDVAAAHVILQESDQAVGRYLCLQDDFPVKALVACLRQGGYTAKLPSYSMEGWLGNTVVKYAAWLSQPKDEGVFVWDRIGKKLFVDTTKLRGLGWTPRDEKETILDTAKDLVEKGFVKN
jgi:dihydroflavonol-4-reductase